jgi:hypothetical protein
MFPHFFDSTMLESFRSCRQKMFLSYIEHWKSKKKSVHHVAGGAYAAGLEAARKAFYVEKIDSDASIKLGLDKLIEVYGDFQPDDRSNKSLCRMIEAFKFYFEQYSFESDLVQPHIFKNGESPIEFGFSEPLDVLHPVTQKPILFVGRADMIATYAGGLYCFDDKTTSSLGASWAKQWDMRGQFTGYQWAAKKIGLNLKGTVVRGVSILKTKCDTMQILTYRSAHEIEIWHKQTLRDIRAAIECWRDGYWDYSLGHACAEWGACSFTDICKSSKPQDWLPVKFEQRVWNPVDRDEVSLEDWRKRWEPASTNGVKNDT